MNESTGRIFWLNKRKIVLKSKEWLVKWDAQWFWDCMVWWQQWRVLSREMTWIDHSNSPFNIKILLLSLVNAEYASQEFDLSSQEIWLKISWVWILTRLFSRLATRDKVLNFTVTYCSPENENNNSATLESHLEH